jgi:hypothetical protein
LTRNERSFYYLVMNTAVKPAEATRIRVFAPVLRHAGIAFASPTLGAPQELRSVARGATATVSRHHVSSACAFAPASSTRNGK